MKYELVETVRKIASRGWAPATGGNFSVVITPSPLRLAMTPSGIHKGDVEVSDLVVVNDTGGVVEGSGKASAETLIHTAIVRTTGAGAVLHTHSVWNTLIGLTGSQVSLSGYEMLKALSGVSTHLHEEVIPILDNSQDMVEFSAIVDDLLHQRSALHAFLMRGHGLYTWGATLGEAYRHVEALEFLFEIEGRKLRRGEA